MKAEELMDILCSLPPDADVLFEVPGFNADRAAYADVVLAGGGIRYAIEITCTCSKCEGAGVLADKSECDWCHGAPPEEHQELRQYHPLDARPPTAIILRMGNRVVHGLFKIARADGGKIHAYPVDTPCSSVISSRLSICRCPSGNAALAGTVSGSMTSALATLGCHPQDFPWFTDGRSMTLRPFRRTRATLHPRARPKLCEQRSELSFGHSGITIAGASQHRGGTRCMNRISTEKSNACLSG